MITRNTDYSIQRLRGLSTDTKPTDVPNGSEFREMDTGKKFLYSAAGTEWIEQAGSGGSGGGGSVEPLVVEVTAGADDGTWELNIAADSMYNQYITGTPVFARKEVEENGATFVRYSKIVKAEKILSSTGTDRYYFSMVTPGFTSSAGNNEIIVFLGRGTSNPIYTEGT